MSTSRPGFEDDEHADGAAAPPIRSGAQDAPEQVDDDAGFDGGTDAERDAADFGGD